MSEAKQNTNNKNIPILIVAGIILIAGLYFRVQKQSTILPTTTTQSGTSIETASDLNQASNDLDSTNIDSVDNDLNQNTVDSQTF